MSESGKEPREMETADPDVAAEEFISRWSQRKSEARESQAETREEPGEAVETEKPVLTDADMPPLESLDQDSDFSGFLSAGVSEKLRRMALRKMFHGAKFNITDGMDDYAEDYSIWVPLGDVVTCDMKHAMERAKEKLQQALDDAAEKLTDESPAETNDPPAENEPMGKVEDLPDETKNSNLTTETQDDQGQS